MNSSACKSAVPWEDIVRSFIHDVRTPLSSITTTLELLRMLEPSSAKSEQLLQMLARQVGEIGEHLQRLAEDPRSFHRSRPSDPQK